MSNQPENSRAPQVTVVIASYHHEKYVREAVDSVLNQTFRDLEVIVVDDGSTDGTPDVVARIADPRLKLIRLPENRVQHPRNIGIAEARGTYIAFQNSDDVWSLSKLEAQVEYMERHPESVACFTGVEMIDSHGRAILNSWAEGIFTQENRSSAGWLRQFFFDGNCLCLPSVMLRKDALVQVDGLRPSLIQESDFDLWVRLAAVGEIYVLGEVFTKMRIIEGQNLSQPSATSESIAKMEHAEILERYLAPEIMDRFEEIFPEWSHFQTKVARQAAMALHHAEAMNGHKIFADRTLATILDDPSDQAHVMEVHGCDLKRRFLANRAAIFPPVIVMPPPKKRVSKLKKLSRFLRGKQKIQ